MELRDILHRRPQYNSTQKTVNEYAGNVEYKHLIVGGEFGVDAIEAGVFFALDAGQGAFVARQPAGNQTG